MQIDGSPNMLGAPCFFHAQALISTPIISPPIVCINRISEQIIVCSHFFVSEHNIHLIFDFIQPTLVVGLVHLTSHGFTLILYFNTSTIGAQ